MKNYKHEKLFSYGTLQDKKVQLQLFNRIVESNDDYILGYQLFTTKIIDPNVISTSGKELHPILKYSGNNLDKTPGKVLIITNHELKKVDIYESSDYQRTTVQLLSGALAWVYVARLQV